MVPDASTEMTTSDNTSSRSGEGVWKVVPRTASVSPPTQDVPDEVAAVVSRLRFPDS